MSAVRDLTDALIAGGMHPGDAAMLVLRMGLELAPPPAAGTKSAGASRMTDYRDRREELGLPRIFPTHQFRPLLEQRDGARCIYCEGAHRLVIDHIHPIYLGGDDAMENLGLACRPCNGRKAGKALESTGMTIKVETARRAHEGYKPRTLFTPSDSEQCSPQPRTQAHTGAHVRGDQNTPLSSLPSDPKKHSEKKEKREANRGSRLPENWEPPESDFEATITAIGQPRAEDELAKFRDHWKAQPGSKGIKSDWPATWRNWTRRAVEYGGNRNGNGTGGNRANSASGQSGSAAILAGVAETAERRARERGGPPPQRPAGPVHHSDAAGRTDPELFGAPNG